MKDYKSGSYLNKMPLEIKTMIVKFVSFYNEKIKFLYLLKFLEYLTITVTSLMSCIKEFQ